MTSSFPFIALLVFIPAGAGLVTALAVRAPQWLIQTIGLVASLATLGIAAAMTAEMSTSYGGYQFVSQHTWAQDLGISWYVGVDGISVFLVLLAAVLFPIVLIGARTRTAQRSFVAWLLLLEAACIGSFVSLDLILFFLFFELTLVPTYFIIGGWGFERRAYAAVKFFIYTFLGSAFLLVGILVVAFLHKSQTGVLSFSLPVLVHTHFSSTTDILLFLAFTSAFAVKAPVFPFHTWSPDAYAEAPTAGSMVLAAVMAKVGTYGIIRFDLNLFPQATIDLAPLLLTLGVVGILYGAIVACAQRDLKRLVAYSSLAQIGFIILGTFALTSQGLTGGVLLMINHGIIVAAFFLLIGWVYERRRTWQVSELRGLQAPAPIMAAAFTVVMMASIGLPGLNGFVSEFLVLLGTFISHRWWAVVATAGVILAAVYLLWAYQQVFHGPIDPKNAATLDLTMKERLVIAPLIALIVVLGVFPGPVLSIIKPSVNRLVAQVHLETRTHQPLVATLGVRGAVTSHVVHTGLGSGQALAGGLVEPTRSATSATAAASASSGSSPSGARRASGNAASTAHHHRTRGQGSGALHTTAYVRTSGAVAGGTREAAHRHRSGAKTDATGGAKR